MKVKSLDVSRKIISWPKDNSHTYPTMAWALDLMRTEAIKHNLKVRVKSAEGTKKYGPEYFDRLISHDNILTMPAPELREMNLTIELHNDEPEPDEE
jgi:hypothetical protein